MKITAALFSQILFLLVISSCSIQEVKDVLPSVLLPKASVNELLLDSARIYLYSSYNNSATVDSLITQIDSTTLTKREKGLYYLTKGYYLQKNGDTKNAIEYLKSAATIIFKSGLKRDKAETNLIWGELFEMTGLITEAKESYFDALEFYKDRPDSKQYFHTILGLSRTIENDTIFKAKANEYLQEYPDIFLEQLYHYTEAYLSKTKEKKHRLFLLYFNKYKQLLAAKELINIYSILATTSKWNNDNNSAIYYINLADSIANSSNIPGSGLIHHYIVSAYLYSSFNEINKAQSILDSALIFAKGQPGMLSQIYLRKYRIDKAQGNIAKANEELSLYLEQEKLQLAKEHEIQTALLTIKYRLYENKLQLIKVRNRWLLFVIILLLGLILIIVFLVNIKRNAYIEKRELQKLNSIASKEYSELLKNYEAINNIVYNNLNNNKKLGFEEYRLLFIGHYPMFIDKIIDMHPGITPIDIRYCISISCGLKNKEISNILEVSSEAVRKAKRKLRSMFSLKDAEEVFEYLQQYKD